MKSIEPLNVNQDALSRSFDIAVVGGGPAGSITGLCLARLGWRVALIEASEFEQERPGETLPPEINPLLRELGVWQDFHAMEPLESPGVVSAWATATRQDSDFTFNPFGSGWHIDRRRFDRMLFDAARRTGACTFTGRKATIIRGGCGWELRREYEPALVARFVVDATGRNGYRMDGSRERVTDDNLLAAVIRISFAGSRPRDLRTCIEATPDGWWYSAPLPENSGIAMFFTDRETYRRGEAFLLQQLECAPLTRRQMHGEIARSHARVVPVSSSCRRQISGNGWLAVGDSASSLDPLSGRGIFKAMKQGMAAARATDAALKGEPTSVDRYAATVRQEFDSYLVQKDAFYASQTRWRDRPFWKARGRAWNVSAA